MIKFITTVQTLRVLFQTNKQQNDNDNKSTNNNLNKEVKQKTKQYLYTLTKYPFTSFSSVLAYILLVKIHIKIPK